MCKQLVRSFVRTHWIVVYAIILHLVWGITLFVSSDPLGITAIASIVKLGIASSQAAGYFYFTVAVLASLSLIAPKPSGFFFLLPQQMALLISALGSIQCMVTGTFADGTIRSSEFLVADQSPVVILAVLHTLSVYSHFITNPDG